MSGAILSASLHTIFWVFVLVYLVVSATLVYHWQKYGGKARNIFVAETIFVAGSVVLLLVAFFLIP